MRRFAFVAFFSLAALPGLALAQATPGAGPNPPAGQQWGHHGQWGHGHHHDPMMLLMKFYAANTTHDGHLTLAQAKAANMKMVVDNFSAIDTRHRGYVTPYDIQAWHMDRVAQRLEQRADQLRAQD